MVAELQFIYQGCHVTILKYKYDFIAEYCSNLFNAIIQDRL